MTTMPSEFGFSAMDLLANAIEKMNSALCNEDLFQSPSLMASFSQVASVYSNAMKEIDWSNEFQSAMQAVSSLQHQIVNQYASVFADEDWTSFVTPAMVASIQNAVATSFDAGEFCEAVTAAVASIAQTINISTVVGEDFKDADKITAEEKEQLGADITEALNDEKNWQQCLYGKIQDWKERYPIAAILLWLIISQIITSLVITPAITKTVKAIKSATLKAEPSTKATAIYKIAPEQNMKIVDDVPYYYLVEIDDPDSDEPIRGYISKKTVNPSLSPTICLEPKE